MHPFTLSSSAPGRAAKPAMHSRALASLAGTVFALAFICVPSASADILLTEVIPNVTTTTTRGDVVELFNTGPGSVDLTGWVLSDLDPDPIAGVPQDSTFAPPALGLPPLAAGDFAVIEFVDAGGTASWQPTNYGLRIVAPLEAGSFLGSERDELLLFDDTDTPIDFVAWSDSGTTVSSDSYDDLAAVTGAVFDFGLTPGTAAWDGDESITNDAEYYANSVDFTAFASVSTWGGGALRRRSTNGVFAVASPDGVAQWEAVARHEATLGNPSDDVPTGNGLRPLRITDDLATWLAQIDSSSFPDRRLAPQQDQSPADFAPADANRRSAWEAVLALALNEQWDEAFAAADAIGYEVVEFLDSASGETFHILRERFIPGDPSFTGMGTFVFFSGTDARPNLVLEVPHPIHDGKTLDEGGLAAPLVRPRLLMIAGTHRNNHTTPTGCDGSFEGGDPYRISDVAHHPDNFFHTAHVWLTSNLPNMLAIQFHGFCCPGVAPYEDVSDDNVISNGVEIAPGPNDFTQIWRTRIDAQNYLVGGVDLTTASVFGDDVNRLGATNNLQGRVSNGIDPGDACDTEAVAASGRFIHIEQDPDVRDDPQHILIALNEALDLFEPAGPSPCDATPREDCRQAAARGSVLSLRDAVEDKKDRFTWRWGKGEATTIADFGDPVAGSATYRVCVYDESASPQPLLDFGVVGAGTCGTKPCWKATSKGFSYRDKYAASDGIKALQLRSGDTGKAKVQAKGTGPEMQLQGLPMTLPVRVQLQIDDGVTVECWESTFVDPPRKNDGEKFRAKQ